MLGLKLLSGFSGRFRMNYVIDANLPSQLAILICALFPVIAGDTNRAR